MLRPSRTRSSFPNCDRQQLFSLPRQTPVVGIRRRNTRLGIDSFWSAVLIVLAWEVKPSDAQCGPCDIVPNGFNVRPGTGCKEFVNCVSGSEAMSNQCGASQLFDLNIKGCNWDYMVTCPPDPECAVGNGIESGADEDLDAGGSDKNDVVCDVPLCAVGESGIKPVPFSSCRSYVMCSQGVPGTPQQCPRGQKYSVQIMACNIDAQVPNCPADPTCPPTRSPSARPSLSISPTLDTTTPAPSPTISEYPSSMPSESPKQPITVPTPARSFGQVDTAPLKPDPELLEGLYVIDAHISANKILIARELLSSANGRGRSSLSSNFSYNGFKESLHTMILQGVSGKSFYIGESKVKNGRVYGLVNIAAFLAMSVADSIQVGSCDEVNTEMADGLLPVSNACGQNGVMYEKLECPADDEVEACPVDINMVANASPATTMGINSQRPPQPFYCKPKDDELDQTGHWDYMSNTENHDVPIESALGRTDVQGCCWWGRGSIHIKGVCAYGRLNHYLGKKAADDGRPAMFPDIDFCSDPGVICSSEKYPDLKWIVGMFRWITEVQTYQADDWSYLQQLINFVDGGLKDWSFIHRVSGIVTQGCHTPPCVPGVEFYGMERMAIFIKTLKLLGLVVDDGLATSRGLESIDDASHIQDNFRD